jgi:hypothetical protein
MPEARARVTASLTQSRMGVLGLAHAPDVTGFDGLLQQHGAGFIDHAHGAGFGDFKGLVVAAVLFGGLRHQAHVGHGAHGDGVQRAVLLAVVDDGLVDAGVAAVRDDGLGVLQLAFGVPHPPESRIMAGMEASTITSEGTCRLVMPLSLTMARAGGRRPGLQVGFDFRALGFGQLVQAGVQVADAVVDVEADLGQCSGVLVEHGSVVGVDHVAEDDGVGDLHHGGLQVSENSTPWSLASCTCAARKLRRAFLLMTEASITSPASTLVVALRTWWPGGGGQLDAHIAGVGHHGGLFAAVEVASIHVGHVGLVVGRPGAHLVRVLAGVVLDRQRCAAVGVAFAQHGFTAEPLTLS